MNELLDVNYALSFQQFFQLNDELIPRLLDQQ